MDTFIGFKRFGTDRRLIHQNRNHSGQTSATDKRSKKHKHQQERRNFTQMKREDQQRTTCCKNPCFSVMLEDDDGGVGFLLHSAAATGSNLSSRSPFFSFVRFYFQPKLSQFLPLTLSLSIVLLLSRLLFRSPPLATSPLS